MSPNKRIAASVAGVLGLAGILLVTTGQVTNPATSGPGSGTVTSVATTSPIAGGPITSTGTITFDTSVQNVFTGQQYHTANHTEVCNAGGTGCGSTPGNFTSANASGLQTITGLQIGPLPANLATHTVFHCNIVYSQATPSAADQFGVKNSVAPTNMLVNGVAQTAASTYQGNTQPALASTTATSVVQFTPGGAGSLIASLDGYIDQPSGSANTVTIQVTNGTAADVIVVARGSSCWWF